MPIALTPRRRSRDEAECDKGSGSASPDMIPSSQLDTTSTKRARLTNGYALSSSNGTPLNNGYPSRTNGLQEETLRSKSTRRNHQPGSIVRVKLTNFVTYTDVEFNPGPSLNMVVGPNGTGKSTLVCAICLGLGWGPQHLGRAKEVSEFVKHGCQEAMIEIELAKDGKKFQRNIVIRCTIKREGNKTIFSVNDKPQGKKAVIELCRSLSIQIDNLCQFLPQDKVVEFAAMTPVELLRSTQRAVASQEMIDMHEQLNEYRRKQKDVQASCAADQDTLANLETRHRMQEADVERMREREQIVKRVSMLEATRPIPAYREARDLFTEAKERKKEAEKELARLKNDVEPSLQALNAKERYKEQIQPVVGERKSVISKAEKHADGLDKKFRDLLDKHNELVGGYNAELNSGKGFKRDIPRLELAINNLKRQMEEQPPEVDVAAYNERIRDRRRAFDNCGRQVKELQDKQRESTRVGKEKENRIQRAQAEMQNLDSQAGKQNIKLQNNSRDTAKMWEWVQQHQDEFEKPVFGPPIVECSIKDPRFVDHIESLFQKGVALSFTVQTKKDFKKFSDCVESLRLTEIYFETMMGGLNDFRAPIGEDEMQRYGFEGMALDYMNGPEPVLAMLCYKLNLHRMGVSSRDTTSQQYKMLENSPIQTWVTSKSTYRIQRRREYGPGAVSTQVQPIKRGTIWTDQPVDLTAKRELQENIHGWTEEIEALKASVAEAQKTIEEYRDAMNKTSEEEKDIAAEKAAKQKAMGEIKALPTKLAAQEGKMAAAQEAMAGMKVRLKAISQKQDEIAMQRAQIALDFAEAVESLRTCHYSLHEAEVMLIEATSDFEILKERNRSVTELIQTQERRVAESLAEASKSRTEAQRLMKIVQDMIATDEELKAFAEELPTQQSVEEHEAEIESEKARLELMHEGNGGVIREFEQRQRKIETLTARLQDTNHALGELDDKIKELRDQWEPELDGLVAKISDSFSTNMEQISCAGEVGVFKDEDFDQWAIQIRVKFRENEPLTTLDSHRQSGGERAVSTIFYLMSLQSLTKSPFRVVDEINQGMDPRNERLVHKRMVGIACGKTDPPHCPNRPNGLVEDEDEDDDGRGGSQYFLITPKLLHNLTYERGMRVLCIASGEYMPEDRGRCDFRGAIDTMKGLKAGWGVAAA